MNQEVAEVAGELYQALNDRIHQLRNVRTVLVEEAAAAVAEGGTPLVQLDWLVEHLHNVDVQISNAECALQHLHQMGYTRPAAGGQ